MKKFLMAFVMVMSLTACKKEEKKVTAAPPVQQVVSVQDLATRSMEDKSDWTRDLPIYIDDVLVCANAAPIQTKYVFRADAFETPAIALILLKGEDDKVYACSIEGDSPTPHYKEIRLSPPVKSPRFYPGELPKADSCLLNTRVLDKTGHTAGWLSKITC